MKANTLVLTALFGVVAVSAAFAQEPNKGAPEIIAEHQKIAEATFKKDARINIRLSSRDLRALQARALKEGIPYQTLVSSVLHKFVDGQLVEKAANK